MSKIAAQAVRVVLKVLALLLLVGCGDEMSPAPIPLELAPASAGLGTPQPGRLSVLGTIVPARRKSGMPTWILLRRIKLLPSTTCQPCMSNIHPGPVMAGSWSGA